MTGFKNFSHWAIGTDLNTVTLYNKENHILKKKKTCNDKLIFTVLSKWGRVVISEHNSIKEMPLEKKKSLLKFKFIKLKYIQKFIEC